MSKVDSHLHEKRSLKTQGFGTLSVIFRGLVVSCGFTIASFPWFFALKNSIPFPIHCGLHACNKVVKLDSIAVVFDCPYTASRWNSDNEWFLNVFSSMVK